MRNMFVPTMFLALAASSLAAPPEVAVVKPVERELKDEMMFVGRTDASTTVEIRARDTGLVEKVLFKEGSAVKQGDVLFQFDSRLRKAELDKAQAEVAVAEAKLKGAEAEFQRINKLAGMKVIPQDELVKYQTVLEEAKGGIQASRAALEVAKLNLERTRIAAPIAGRIGLSNVTVGTLVKGDGDTLLATIIVADPLYVYFEVDDRSLLRLTKLGKEAKLPVIVNPGGDSKSSYEATIDFVDNKVNVNNNTIRVRATLPNPKGELVPGLYAKVRVVFGPSRKVLCLPRSTMSGGDDGLSVLVVNDKNVLVERKIKTGPAIGDLRAVEDSVKADDVVVLHRQGLKAGDEIKRRPEKTPATPKPDGGAAKPRPLPDLPGTGPALIVSATYAGANARVVEQVVAGPIAEQINGMEGLLHRFHSCTDDGEMRMTLLLKKGTDLNAAQVIAQNRLAVTVPALPDEVRRHGISVRKRGVHLASLALYSPDGTRDRDFIEAYANKRLRDELLRVPSIIDAAFYADTSPQPRFRLSIDKDRSAALGLATEDVTRAIRAEAVLTPQIALADSAKTPEELRKIVIKVVGDGVPIRVGDVATFEEVVERNTLTCLDGRPCVLLLVLAIAEADRAKVKKDLPAYLKEISGKLPSGLAFQVLENDE